MAETTTHVESRTTIGARIRDLDHDSFVVLGRKAGNPLAVVTVTRKGSRYDVSVPWGYANTIDYVLDLHGAIGYAAEYLGVDR